MKVKITTYLPVEPKTNFLPSAKKITKAVSHYCCCNRWAFLSSGSKKKKYPSSPKSTTRRQLATLSSHWWSRGERQERVKHLLSRHGYFLQCNLSTSPCHMCHPFCLERWRQQKAVHQDAKPSGKPSPAHFALKRGLSWMNRKHLTRLNVAGSWICTETIWFD